MYGYTNLTEMYFLLSCFQVFCSFNIMNIMMADVSSLSLHCVMKWSLFCSAVWTCFRTHAFGTSSLALLTRSRLQHALCLCVCLSVFFLRVLTASVTMYEGSISVDSLYQWHALLHKTSRREWQSRHTVTHHALRPLAPAKHTLTSFYSLWCGSLLVHSWRG